MEQDEEVSGEEIPAEDLETVELPEEDPVVEEGSSTL
jgi:hypothetical protein